MNMENLNKETIYNKDEITIDYERLIESLNLAKDLIEVVKDFIEEAMKKIASLFNSLSENLQEFLGSLYPNQTNSTNLN